KCRKAPARVGDLEEGAARRIFGATTQFKDRITQGQQSPRTLARQCRGHLDPLHQGSAFSACSIQYYFTLTIKLCLLPGHNNYKLLTKESICPKEIALLWQAIDLTSYWETATVIDWLCAATSVKCSIIKLHGVMLPRSSKMNLSGPLWVTWIPTLSITFPAADLSESSAVSTSWSLVVPVHPGKYLRRHRLAPPAVATGHASPSGPAVTACPSSVLSGLRCCLRADVPREIFAIDLRSQIPGYGCKATCLFHDLAVTSVQILYEERCLEVSSMAGPVTPRDLTTTTRCMRQYEDHVSRRLSAPAPAGEGRKSGGSGQDCCTKLGRRHDAHLSEPHSAQTPPSGLIILDDIP
ncbi:LOW QUALITY PROTEIN: DDB1- and CUL4-associated factor 4, partial [Galemys pyrenaicus]